MTAKPPTATTEAKLAAFESLMTEVSTALADVVECMQSGSANANEVSNTLVEMLGVMQAFKPQEPQSFQSIADAIAKLQINVSAPQVTVKSSVEVNPTPIENIINVAPSTLQIMPGERGLVDYDMTVEYDQLNRITRTRLTALPRKK